MKFMSVLLTMQVIIVVFLVIVVLMQNPNVDGLAGLNSNVNNNSAFSNNTSGNFLTKLTYIIAALFIINSLCIMATQKNEKHSIIEQIVQEVEVPSDD